MSGFLYHEALYRSASPMAKIRVLPVTICGAGALGANITESLARTGFTRLKIIDQDRVEERNLSTQPYYRTDIGAYKATLLANMLYRALGIRLEAQPKALQIGNVSRLLKGTQLVVDTFDNSVARTVIQDHCTKTKQACLHVGLARDYAEVVWNEHYQVPSDAQDDLCDYPLARNLVTLTTAVACETLVRYATHGVRNSHTITLGDFAIRSLYGTTN